LFLYHFSSATFYKSYPEFEGKVTLWRQ